ncbi:MAG: molybdenum cofactor biosynthesis protein B [Desulfatibacillaceae bacterium]
MGVHEHRKHGRKRVSVAVITVSSTRGQTDDESGIWIEKHVRAEGHEVVSRQVVADDVYAITTSLREILASKRPHAVLINGGTGITPRDVTIEAVQPLFDKEMPAFAHIFSLLSFDKVDTAALLSRAAAGVIDGVFVACMPGSPRACRLAVGEILLPELGHICGHLR